MRRLLSYMYPMTQKVSSKLNDTLEITWYNGKKYLNTKNANYSYGSLQKILKIGLEKIDLSTCRNVLILGLGGGSVIQTLRKDFNYRQHVTAVEIDPVIIRIANEEFHIVENQKLQIICTDALEFMKQNKKLYDLIIVDVYIDTTVPSAFLELAFWQHLIRASPNSILFNASVETTENNKLPSIISYLKKENFNVEKMIKVNDTNTLIIAKV